MSKSILFNVVREALPNSPVDDQGLMDIARIIVGTTWPTDLGRLRFIGFRSSFIAAGGTLNLNTNEIGIATNVFSANPPVINGTVINNAQLTFGVVFNRIAANVAGSCYVQYALFTYQ